MQGLSAYPLGRRPSAEKLAATYGRNGRWQMRARRANPRPASNSATRSGGMRAGSPRSRSHWTGGCSPPGLSTTPSGSGTRRPGNWAGRSKDTPTRSFAFSPRSLRSRFRHPVSTTTVLVILRSEATKNLFLQQRIASQERDSSLPSVAQNDISTEVRL